MSSYISALKAHLSRLFFGSTPTTNPVESLASSTVEPPECKFRLDNGTSDTLILPDGRKLGYAQYGSPTGQPILYQHGLPGSRLEAAALHSIGLEAGARIIAADRPGYGWSSPHRGRAILDFPKDLRHLTSHLGIKQYGVLGVSGGGPYALACAAALPPEKLKCVSVICGIGPPDIGMSGANWVNWVGFTFGWRYAWPGAIRWLFTTGPAGPSGRLELTDEQRFQLHMQAAAKVTNAKDASFLQDPDYARLFVRTAREAFGRGFEHVRDDGRLMCMDWGFRIQDVRPDLSVRLWYGEWDTNVPINHGRQIAARLGGRARFRVEDETHASIWVNCREEAVRDMVNVMEGKE